MKKTHSLRRFVPTLANVTLLALLSQQVASAAPAVLGLWRFNEGSGTNTADSSGLGNNGTLTGENGNLPTWVSGQTGFGGALKFINDGTNHTYVDISGAASLLIGQTATDPWSITLWAYETSNGTNDFVATYGRFIVTDDGQAFQFESGASGDGQLYTWSRANMPWQIGWGIGSAVAPLLDQWVHWAVVYDGANLTIYRNANQGPNAGIASTAGVDSPLSYPGYTGAVRIGSELGQPPDRNWNGMLDDVAVFVGALSPSQVATVMSGDFSAFLGGPPGIISRPTSQTVTFGSTATFTVGVYGQAPFHYQWYFNNTNKLSSSVNPTATNATLVLANAQFSQAGGYSVVITNSVNSVTSQVATLNVVFNSNLVGLWRFNEASGTNILDSSGLANNGYLTGENGNVPARVTGQPGFGGALRFTNNGLDHAYVVIPNNPPLAIGQTATNPWTLTAWAYENSNGAGDFVATYGRILVIDDGKAFQLESGASGDGEIYTWSRANFAWQVNWGVGNSVSPLFDQWEHWAVVYDGTNLNLYRNGNSGPNGGMLSIMTNAPLGGYSGYQDGIIIGSELAPTTADRTWDGMLDDIAVFNIPLSQTQIQKVMSGDFSAFVPRPPLSINPNGANMILSWSANQPTFQLQSKTNLTSGSWANVATPPVQNGGMLEVTVPKTAGPEFFRLVGP